MLCVTRYFPVLETFKNILLNSHWHIHSTQRDTRYFIIGLSKIYNPHFFSTCGSHGTFIPEYKYTFGQAVISWVTTDQNIPLDLCFSWGRSNGTFQGYILPKYLFETTFILNWFVTRFSPAIFLKLSSHHSFLTIFLSSRLFLVKSKSHQTCSGN